ncbi:tyrosine-protein phosphatase 10D isoform X1 [Maniola jurtina]|uniref:tyrosine-protein phosphatase 10D isoform X1 n=1 Tax=Maniola jurtina TaxID=191418 RepID=UPI001E68A5C5|nr:tyrosine-protein phosphatase 10D isoform X1 [Maniola jurtina]
MLPQAETDVSLEEKVSCEIGESPSVMWMRSIVQAKAGHTRATAAPALALALAVFIALCGAGRGADLVIEIPGWGGAGDAEGAHYRLDYRPPQGSPAPNFTVPARASTINFQGLPGTKYHFMLYYSNATFADLLTWNQTIITAPEPPTNLTVTLGRNKQATISWAPPAHGDYTGFRFKVIPLTERAEGGARNVTLEGAGNWSHVLRDLSPGATYQLHAFTLLHDKESAAYASFNFTTKPNTPGKFIVWFRNETTLLVLWQPPYPPGAYTHYKVSIEPRDARDSELYVEKEGEPPGPAQAAFKGLVPGRAYNISVQTVSDAQLSAPTTAQYRTVPLRPRNVSVDPALRSETAFRVTWLPPAEQSEFEKYQISVSAGGAGARRLPPQLRSRDEPPYCSFEGLEPGAHYAVTVKTMSGKVTSWPAAADVTLKPLPVRELHARRAEGAEGSGVLLWWTPAEGSTQDEYKVSYHETGPSRDDSNSLTTPRTNATLEALLPGRNYTVSVAAVSRGVASDDAVTAVATRPLAPALRAAAPQQRALRLAWSSDVNSRQERYELRFRRRGAEPARLLDTAATNATLDDLLPGAVYEIQLAAVSHGLRSELHTVLKPVRPLPPEWLAVERATSNSVLLRWRGPSDGLVGAYSVRYGPVDAPARRLDPLPPTADHAEITNMTHGERYSIQLDTLSEDAAGESVDSGQPLSAHHTVRPNPVSNVAQLADTRNVTLEWPRPAGRVEWYRVRWWEAEGEADAPDAPDAAQQRDVAAGEGRAARVLLGALQPGRGYALSIAAHSYNLSSELFTMHTRTRPLIQSEMTIVNESDDDRNDTLPAIRVLYTRTPAAATRFDAYRFRLEGGDEPARWQTRAADAADQQVEFSGLVPGRLYNLTMWTVSRNVTSHPVQRQARLFPRPVAALRAEAAGARSVALAWPRPPGDYTDFELQWLAAADTLEARTTAQLALTVDGLRPYTDYTFSVEVRSGTPATILTRSAARSASVRTLEAPPAAPSRFQPADTKPAQIAFTWELPPRDAHGVLRRFVLEYFPPDDPAAARRLEFPPEAREGTVTGLTAGAEYEFRLAARAAGRRAPQRQHRHGALPRRRLLARQRQRHGLRAGGGRGAARGARAPAHVARRAAPARVAALPGVGALLPVPRRLGGGVHAGLGALRGRRALLQRTAQAGHALLRQAARLHRARQVHRHRLRRRLHRGRPHGLDRGRRRGGRAAAGAGGGRAAAAPAPRRARARRARRQPPRARGRLRRALPAHGGRLRLPLQRGVRRAEARGARAAVRGGRPSRQPAQEPLHQHPAVRPLALQAAARGRRGGQRLHQRQLRARPLQPARVHRDAGPAALHARRLLAHGVGVGQPRRGDADALRGEGPREVRPLLALRHAARAVRRHRRHGAQREPLPRLDRHGAGREPRRRAARRHALPLHHVARLRRAVAAHGAGALRARLPRALPARRRRAPRRGALQRGRGPLGHLHHAGPRAAAAGRARRHAGHLRHGARHAARARVDGADGAAVHLHPPVRAGRARGRRPGAAAARQPPPQRRLRRRRGHRGVGHVSRRQPPAASLHRSARSPLTRPASRRGRA